MIYSKLVLSLKFITILFIFGLFYCALPSIQPIVYAQNQSCGTACSGPGQCNPINTVCIGGFCVNAVQGKVVCPGPYPQNACCKTRPTTPPRPPSPTPGTNDRAVATPPPTGGLPTQPPTDANLTCNNCDANGDGAVDQTDFDLLQQKAANGSSEARAIYNYCIDPMNQCVSGRTTPPPVGGSKADCAGPQGGGQPDGIVDLLDFNQLRIEFNDDTPTLYCDFDHSGDVDLPDFLQLRTDFSI